MAGARALPPSDEIARPAGAVEALRFAGDALWALDQTRLPGAEVVLELRGGEEVRGVTGLGAQTPVRNLAFDVTPAGLVTALVTERGIARPVNAETVAGLLASIATAELEVLDDPA